MNYCIDMGLTRSTKSGKSCPSPQIRSSPRAWSTVLFITVSFSCTACTNPKLQPTAKQLEKCATGSTQTLRTYLGYINETRRQLAVDELKLKENKLLLELPTTKPMHDANQVNEEIYTLAQSGATSSG